MYNLSHGKTTTASYSFKFAGKEYRGSDTVSSNHCFCDVAVYFDPNHPSTNTLVEYGRKAKQDHAMMMGCSYASVGLANALACVLAFRKPKNKPATDDLHLPEIR